MYTRLTTICRHSIPENSNSGSNRVIQEFKPPPVSYDLQREMESLEESRGDVGGMAGVLQEVKEHPRPI